MAKNIFYGVTGGKCRLAGVLMKRWMQVAQAFPTLPQLPNLISLRFDDKMVVYSARSFHK